MAGVLINADAVDLTLRRWAREPFRWGETDCALSVFRHIAEAWSDPRLLTEWVLRYGDERAALRLVAARGGQVRLMGEEMARIGAKAVDDARRGDVGLIRDGNSRIVAGLCVGDGRWAARTVTGFAVVRPAWARAWRKEG